MTKKVKNDPEEVKKIVLNMSSILQNKKYDFAEKESGMTQQKFEQVLDAITSNSFSWEKATLHEYFFGVEFALIDWPYFKEYSNRTLDIKKHSFPGLLFNIYVERWIHSKEFGKMKWERKQELINGKHATEADFTGDVWTIGFSNFALFSNISNIMETDRIVKENIDNILPFVESEESRIPQVMASPKLFA